MKIPIFNSIYNPDKLQIKTKPLNLNTINNLNLKKVDLTKFPLVNSLRNLPKFNSLYETVLVTVNDYFKSLLLLIRKYSNLKDFQKFKRIKPQKVHDIYELRDYVSLKLDTLGI